MIPSSFIIGFSIAAVVTLLLPVVMVIVLGVKKKISGLPLLFGALAFFISQIALRVPLLNSISGQQWFVNFSASYYVLCRLLISLSAGLFEETARLGGALILKKRRSYKDVISFGLGHALCEVVLVTGIGYATNIVLCLAINNPAGTFAASLPSDLMETVVAQLAEAKPHQVYLGILERVSAVISHIFATVLVFRGVTEKKWHYYLFAVLAHTMFNFSMLMLSRSAGVVIAQMVMFVVALAMGYYAIKSKDSFINETAEKHE